MGENRSRCCSGVLLSDVNPRIHVPNFVLHKETKYYTQVTKIQVLIFYLFSITLITDIGCY